MKVVTHSSCESEYVGLSEAGNEGVHLQQLQGELKIGSETVWSILQHYLYINDVLFRSAKVAAIASANIWL